MSRINTALWRCVTMILITCMGVTPEELAREDQERRQRKHFSGRGR